MPIHTLDIRINLILYKNFLKTTVKTKVLQCFCLDFNKWCWDSYTYNTYHI